MKNFLISCFIVSMWFVPQGLSAQWNPTSLDRYKELEGSYIYDLLPDRMGNIWIASLGGLVKYDGYEFQHFHPDPNDSTTISSLNVYSLFEDEGGKIWIGSHSSIYALDPATKLFSTYPIRSLLDYPDSGWPMVTEVCTDSEGKLYFGVVSGIGLENQAGLIYYDAQADEMKRIQTKDGVDPENVIGLTQMTDGSIIVSAFNDVFTLHLDGNLVSRSLEDFGDIGFYQYERPTDNVAGDEGSIWFTTNYSRLWQYQSLDNSFRYWSYRDLFEEPPTPRSSSYMIMDRQGDLLISGEQGLIRFDPESEKFDTVAFDLINENNISKLTALQFDDFGNLWVGTRSDGIFKLPNRNYLTSYVHNPEDTTSLTEGWISEIFEGDDGSIWLPAVDGGGGQGLNRINPRTGKIDNFLYSDILPDHYGINLLGAIRPGEFLFESTQGIKIYLTKTGQVIDSDFDLVKDQIPYSNELFIDKNSNIWLCTQSGLFRLRNKGIERFDLTEHEYSSGVSNEVTKVVESRRGGLWIQTNDGIFFIDETTEKIERHGHPGSGGDVLTSQDINALHEDKDGILWVGTWQGGLNRYNPETGEIKVYDIDSGLPSMSVQGILGDEKNGALWLSTFSGMSRFNIETEQFMNFTPADGAQSLLYADGAAYITSDGLFVFGGSMGINLFDPDDISENSLPPKVQITDFKIGSESMDAESINSATENPIALQHNQNNLSIDYTGIQHDNPSENRFAYRIDNYDDDWRDVGLLRSAYYYNLPPGEYNFQVKAANSNGVWSEPVSLAFNISPPWWRTWWAYLTYGFLIAAGLIYLDGWRKHQLVKKERALAKEKELEHAREIEKAYSELKSTQAQLIQSEKMASLGELTAGIAHEIQNPLNFVNNFSDVSNELLAEMKEEIVQGNTEDALEIVDDLSQNLSKINLHGDRASSIVQNMLQHSRPSSDEKIETDINALCDEFVRLSFHGLRAKDKTFNAAIETNFDKELPKLQVVAQDIGRVFLNIMNNAFYAVDQRNKRNENGFKPTVSISTKNKKEKIEISIKDNGSGIPPNQVDKIFEPFFTTKPTGKGTGLGLSLSYDIIKAHGGELKVESEIGKGSAFIIELPV